MPVKCTSQPFCRWCGKPIGKWIEIEFSTWDGESYEDDLFCDDSHAAAFGRQSARQHGFGTKAYTDAIAKSR